MKTKFVVLIGIIYFGISGLKAQLTLDCESGNRSIEQGNCWAFGSNTYTNSGSLVILGSWSCQSNQLTNPSPTASWVKTPWMLPGTGTISLQARLSASNGTTKGIRIFYVPYDAANPPYYEGTPVEFYSWDWPAINTTVHSLSATIPSAIENATEPYKIRVSFVGSGGTSRAITDNYLFPGTYWSDPSNSCMPLSFVSDSDSDGVSDTEDQYPTDPYRAYASYFPSELQTGTLAFEDLWPGKGDYDFNDLVVDYKIQTVSNAQNNVVELLCKFVLRASGASFHNAFGFQLDGIAPNKIQSVTGNSIGNTSIFSMASNGLEDDQTYATCIVFDDFFDVMTWPGSGNGINTSTSAPFVPYDTLQVTITFIANGVPPPGGVLPVTSLPQSIFNFFIVVNQNRGREVHLPDRLPTSLADDSFFGTSNDDSNPSQGRYYKTSNNLPWAINIVQGFDYPVEKVPVDQAHLKFVDWAGSGGLLFQDWFENTKSNRDDKYIYSIP